MKKLDIEDCEFDNVDSCYHLTRATHKSSIEENGLGANIGIRSKGGLGNEKTNKVFFAKSIKGALIFLNRNINIFYSAVKHNDFEILRKGLEDDSCELYEEIFNEMVYKNMSQDEKKETAIALGKLYLERGIYYKLDLKYSTREEFENMSKEEQDEIDYFSDDINEERPEEAPTINNMHTRTGRGIKPSQMSLMTDNGKRTALDIAIRMSEHYKTLYPGEPLPVLEYNNNKDLPLLEMLIDRERNIEIGSTTIESLVRQALGKDNVRISEVMQVDRTKDTLENTKEGVSLDD